MNDKKVKKTKTNKQKRVTNNNNNKICWMEFFPEIQFKRT